MRRNLPVVLTVVIGLLVGIGVTAVALRDGDAEGVAFDSGPPSVREIERPAGVDTGGAAPTAAEILDRAARATPLSAPAAEPADARAALEAFLAAEASGRTDDSFALLDADGQRGIVTPAAWRQARADRSVARSSRVEAERRAADGSSELTVRAERAPEISPFRGLVAAQTVEVWRVRQDADAGGWRVAGGRPVSAEPQLPPDATAVTAAQRWVDRAARCDAAVADLQLPGPLLGVPGLAALACEGRATWRTDGPAVRAADLPEVTPFVAAYGPSVGRWGRGVTVALGDERFTVLLGPVGQEWRVMGLLPVRPA